MKMKHFLQARHSSIFYQFYRKKNSPFKQATFIGLPVAEGEILIQEKKQDAVRVAKFRGPGAEINPGGSRHCFCKALPELTGTEVNVYFQIYEGFFWAASRHRSSIFKIRFGHSSKRPDVEPLTGLLLPTQLRAKRRGDSAQRRHEAPS